MDEIKLARWRANFLEGVKQAAHESSRIAGGTPLESLYEMDLDESGEWKIVFKEGLPEPVRRRLEEILSASKPEDSI